MNILVTGGAGFLGSNLVMRLLYQGHSVTAVDNLLTGTLANLGNAFKQYPETFSFINRNVSQRGATLGPIDHGAGWDRVYHLASAASPAVYKKHPIKTLRVGTIGTENMLQHANHWRARMLFASTSEVYGQPLKHPQSEGYFGNVNPIGPRSMYDEAKRCGEAFVMAYHYAKGVDTRIARIFNTYGPGLRGDDGRMIPAFVMAALAGEAIPVHGSGLQTRTLCYVDDTVDGLIRLMENESTEAHLPVNIGGHQEMTVCLLYTSPSPRDRS